MRAIHQTKTKLIFGFAVRPIGSAPIGSFDHDQVGLMGILGEAGVPLLPKGSAHFNPLVYSCKEVQFSPKPLYKHTSGLQKLALVLCAQLNPARPLGQWIPGWAVLLLQARPPWARGLWRAWVLYRLTL